MASGGEHAWTDTYHSSARCSRVLKAGAAGLLMLLREICALCGSVGLNPPHAC